MSLRVDAIVSDAAGAPVLPSSRLRVLFYVGALALAVADFLGVYFIMPLPGSQRLRSIALAYTLYAWRWPIRLLSGLVLIAGIPAALRESGWRRWLVPGTLVATAAAVYVFNIVMAADQMFKEPTVLTMLPSATNSVPKDRLVVGLEVNGAARAYPLMFIGYHHQVRDTVGGRAVLVSYCTVCRTGRVFSPEVEGKPERFRLVGMDHFNAMFEDQTTGSWWRQANGEAIAGPRKGMTLAELPSLQVTLAQWLALHPASLVMQGDPIFAKEYAKDYSYEKGTSRKTLTGTDTASWKDKSWVVGIAIGDKAKAYDWNRLKRERVINDAVGGTPIVLVLAADTVSFFAYARPDSATRFELRGDSLASTSATYALTGTGTAGTLRPVSASQEFWHSWRTFQPNTDK